MDRQDNATYFAHASCSNHTKEIMKKRHTALKETVQPGVFTPWQEVEVEIQAFTELGMKVIVDGEYMGLVYGNMVFDYYYRGQKLKAYIKCVREDGKIDVSLQPKQGVHVQATTDKIIEHLKAAGGRSKYNDGSSPEAIKSAFQVSKKVFKQALGSLYKQGKIIIEDDGIAIVDKR